VLTESDVELSDGRTLHLYDAADGRDVGLTLFRHQGTPNLRAPP
jgi:hypothetical protein